MQRETPTMLAANFSNSTYSLGDDWKKDFDVDPVGDVGAALSRQFIEERARGDDVRQMYQRRLTLNPPRSQQPQKGKAPPKEINMTTVRLVRVIIADTNKHLPLSSRLLYKSDELWTDLTDQELFYELDIKDILARHNEVRAKTINKDVKDRTEYLEPARVRDLTMSVVSIAEF